MSRKPPGYWSEEALIEDAKKYTSLKEWRANSQSAYVTAKAKRVLDKCVEYLDRDRKPSGYWNKYKCHKEANKYLTIKEWSLADGASYDYAKRNKFITEITTHMIKTLSVGELTLYSLFLRSEILFEFQKRFDDLKDKSYLPFDFYLPDFNLVIEYQGRQHFKVSKSSRYKKDIKKMQYRDQLKREYALKKSLNYIEIDMESPQDIEQITINKILEIKPTWKLTQRQLTDEEKATLSTLGQWDKESVIAEAQTYSTVTDWKFCGNASEQIARKRGWFDEAVVHMKRLHKSSGYWSLERIRVRAEKYKTKTEWRLDDPNGYAAAQRKGYLNDVTKHMTPLDTNSNKMPRGYWTHKRIIANAQGWGSIQEWRLSPQNGYRYAKERGVFEAATAHMETKRKPPNYWTKEKVFEDAKGYSSKKSWRMSNSGSYRKAIKSGWADEILDLLDF